LQSDNKGLKLPVVEITDAKIFQLSADGSEAVGMVVYNNKNNTIDGNGTGIYVWNGSKWQIVNPIPVTNIDVISVAESVATGTELQFYATVYPANATNKNITWSVIPDTGTGNIDDSGLFTAGNPGTVKIRATSRDGSSVYGEKEISITGPGKAGEYNIYCYPNNLGCWMIENSKEGESSMSALPDIAGQAHGYYYALNQAHGACPTGFHLPSSSEWSDLARYLNWDASAIEKFSWFDHESQDGYWSSGSLNGWREEGHWWISDLESEFTVDEGLLVRLELHGETETVYLSVRCIKDN
jgi:uncharacterized protein (TIGR02145 family)